MATFTKKNTVEAVQYDGSNTAAIQSLVGNDITVTQDGANLKLEIGPQNTCRPNDYVLVDSGAIMIMDPTIFTAMFNPA